MEDWLLARALSTPRALALVIGDQSWDYGALNVLVEHFARALSSQITVGDRIAVLLPNNLHFACLIHAAARMGAVLVPLNRRLSPSELAWQIERARCKVIIASQETATMLAKPAPTDPPLLLSEDLAASQPRGPERWPPVDTNRLQSIVFTSGTTGSPKGAKLTLGNHFYSAVASSYRLGVEPMDLWLCCLPLYHVGGMAIMLRSCLYGTAAILHDGFDLQAIRADLIMRPVTLLSLVPTMLHRLLRVQPATQWPETLRHVLLGGAAVPPELLAICHKQGIPVSVTYGLTEAASQVATMIGADVWHKPGSSGHPLLFTQLKIVNSDGDRLLPRQIGEIIVKGPTVMSGYDGDEAATNQALRAGWLFTGDMGYLDEDGDLWVVQRGDDIIISGGENIYPAEVEAILASHPQVEEVCVVGLAEPEWGQIVAAALVLASDESLDRKALTAFCRDRLAGYKIPRRVLFLKELPKTASGKIHRRAVAEKFLADSRT
ncbi:MAG: o-succinylbenzoate--CoA ligase [Candidatus Promineifilaceae bacterium]